MCVSKFDPILFSESDTRRRFIEGRKLLKTTSPDNYIRSWSLHLTKNIYMLRVSPLIPVAVQRSKRNVRSTKCCLFSLMFLCKFKPEVSIKFNTKIALPSHFIIIFYDASACFYDLP
jgi:hypothetical protein